MSLERLDTCIPRLRGELEWQNLKRQPGFEQRAGAISAVLRFFAGVLVLSAMVPAISFAQAGTRLPSVAYTGLIFGDSWTFAYRIPPGWMHATCASPGTFITLWPKHQQSQSAKALISVKVFSKNNIDFANFVQREIADLKEGASQSSKIVISRQTVISPTRRSIHIEHSSGNRDELVQYVKGSTAYFAVVLTAASRAAIAQYQPAYATFVDSFVTWPLKCSGKACWTSVRHRGEACEWSR